MKERADEARHERGEEDEREGKRKKIDGCKGGKNGGRNR